MRLPLSVYRSRIGVQWADPSVRPSCVVTPRYSRWFMDGRSAPLSRPRKGWDSKMYPLTLSRHESERATFWLSRPRKEWDSKMYLLTLSRHESERAPLGLPHPWRRWRGMDVFAPLPIRQEEREALELSRPWRGGRGADIFAPCLYSFLVTITPRLTFHF